MPVRKVTRAELLQAIHNPLGVHTMVAVKYRTPLHDGALPGRILPDAHGAND